MGSSPVVRQVFQALIVDEETAVVAPAGASKGARASRFDLDFALFEEHRRHTGSWVAKVAVDERTSIVIPCVELMRFYFGTSGSLAAQLLSGAKSDGRLYEAWSFSATTRSASLTLGEGLHATAAVPIARIAGDRIARRAFWDVAKSGTVAIANRAPWYPKMRFPFIGRTDLTCEGVWLNYPDCRIFVVYRLLQCTHPLPFMKLFYRLASPRLEKRELRPASQEVRPLDVDSTQRGEPVRDALAGGRDAGRTGVEIDPGPTDLDPFPDLRSKPVILLKGEQRFGQKKSDPPGALVPDPVAPMGSSGGALDAVEFTPVEAHQIERHPPLLSKLIRAVQASDGTGFTKTVRSPIGGSGPFRLECQLEGGASKVSWLLLVERRVQASAGMASQQVLINYANQYLNGEGFEMTLFTVDPRVSFTAEACLKLATHETSTADEIDPIVGVSLVEGASGVPDSGDEAIVSIVARANILLAQASPVRIKGAP